MEKISHLELSDYQRAVLTEIGVSCWQLLDPETNQKQEKSHPTETVAPDSQVISKQNALAKLQQLKTEKPAPEPTDAVLVTFSKNDTQLAIFNDVLIALGADIHQQKYISSEQLVTYSGSPLCWTQGDKVTLANKTLTTPVLAELSHPQTKKQLWQALQHALVNTKD